jgi:uncharacterized small protein (DUF1192 family)
MTKMEVSPPQGIQERIQILRKELEERETALPRHTIRPRQLMAIEELEDQISVLKAQIASLPNQKDEQK